MGKFPLIGRPPLPPSKSGKTIFFLFNIWGLKSVLMQRIIFLWRHWGKLLAWNHPVFDSFRAPNFNTPHWLDWSVQCSFAASFESERNNWRYATDFTVMRWHYQDTWPWDDAYIHERERIIWTGAESQTEGTFLLTSSYINYNIQAGICSCNAMFYWVP